MIPMVIDGENVWRCPRRPIKDDPVYWQRLLFFYGQYKEGRLPDEGAITSQSFKAMMLFGVIEDTMAEVEKSKDEQRTANARRGGG